MQLLFRRISSKRKVSFFKLCSDCLPRQYTMTEGQKKISSFFNPLAQKRGNVESDEKETKKQKLESTPTKQNVVEDRENTPEPQHTTSPLGSNAISPEQKARMEGNKNTAKLKIIEKQTGGLVTNIGLTWYQALEPEFSKPYFSTLCKFVNEERKKSQVFPPVNEVFSWTRMGNIKDVKVVILGQDPYHGPRQAHGLCFSVQKGIKIPPSLENMYKELQNDIEGFKHPGHGYLTGWAKQGVLLLNACLTVKAHQANSHKDKGWEKFTDSVVSWLNKNRSDVVFILWGAYAQKKGAFINKERHHVIKGPHPSPLSAHRGFFGCKHFSQCNKLLTDQGKAPIDWTDLPPQD